MFHSSSSLITYCTDIDECQTANDTCHENAECINTDGGFECECKVGFTGNETYCDGMALRYTANQLFH